MKPASTTMHAGRRRAALFLAAVVLLSGSLGGCSSSSDPERPVPPGFPQLTGTIQPPTGFWMYRPYDVEIAPDGRLFILQPNAESGPSQCLEVLSAAGVFEREILLDLDRFAVSADRIFTVGWWNERVDVYDRTGAHLTQFTLDTAQPVTTTWEFDVAASPDGDVYVLDPALRRVQRFSPEGQLRVTWGERGTGPAQMETPARIVVDRQGDVYVLDIDLWRIQKFSPAGALLTTWDLVHTVQFGHELRGDLTVDGRGRPIVLDVTWAPGRVSVLPAGGGDPQYWTLPDESDSCGCSRPPAIAARGEEILLVDYCMSRVARFSATGSLLGTIGRSYGSAPGELMEMTALAAEPAGGMVLLDGWTGRLERYAPDGRYLGPRPGASSAGFDRMASTPDGDVWLAGSWMSNRVIQKSPEGTILHDWTLSDDSGQPVIAKGDTISIIFPPTTAVGTLIALAVAPEEMPVFLINTSSGGRVELRTPEGELVRSLPLPRTYRDLAVDQIWRAWLIDSAGNILVLNLLTGAGEPFPGLAAVPGGVQGPKRIAFDGQDNLYILDSSLPRILLFDRLGSFVGEFGREELAGSMIGRWGHPPFAVSADGGVAVATDTRTALIYRP